jgi:AcrR family transcriptional regulator
VRLSAALDIAPAFGYGTINQSIEPTDWIMVASTTKGTTAERILDVAEGLFAEHGYKAVSLRSILRQCGANIAAAHYHFGSKQQILESIFQRRCGVMNGERLRLLAACRAEPGRPPMLEQILDAFLRPSLLWPDDDSGTRRFMRLRAGVAYEREALARNLIAQHFNETSRRFIEALGKVLPQIGTEELYFRFHFLLGAQYYTLLNPNRIFDLSGGVCDPADADKALRHMVCSFAAALSAPACLPSPSKEIVA